MLSQNHVQTARDFLVASDKEFEAEDYLQASEKLWGAASHATLALAKQKGSRDNRLNWRGNKRLPKPGTGQSSDNPKFGGTE